MELAAVVDHIIVIAIAVCGILYFSGKIHSTSVAAKLSESSPKASKLIIGLFCFLLAMELLEIFGVI